MTAMLLHALAVLAQGAEPPLDDPVVLAKGKAFIVHGLPGVRAKELHRPEPPAPAFLLHTSLPSGKTRTLLRTGTEVGMLVPMAIDRWPVTQKRIVGVAADKERLYTLLWTVSWNYEDFAGKGLMIGKPPESDRYTLHAFWLEDGSEIGSVALGGKKRPRAVPAGRMDKGPLEVKDGAISVYGETFQYKGRKRVEKP